MEIKDLIKIQREFDKKHGFNITKDPIDLKYDQISKDLIGLFGEVGEFSNIIKKINLMLDQKDNLIFEDIVQKESMMKEELIDIFIYFIRLCDFLDIDFENEFLGKIKLNEIKYANYKK